MALIYNASFDSQTRVLSLLDKAGNVISSCEVPSKELVDDPSKPLMLRAIADNSSVTLRKYGTLSNTYQTSTNGTDWTDYTLGTKISLNKGESVYFRCSNHPTTHTKSNYVKFVMRGKIEAWHNAYSMISSSFTDTGYSVGEYGMFNLFNSCASLTKAPLLLNALAGNCYYNMFKGCTSLVQPPELPAMTLASLCYFNMFSGCTSLVQAPNLPAKTLEGNCYDNMFKGCTSLVQAPNLPAKTLASACYYYMFSGCTSLVQAPNLPAKTLAGSCYSSMFQGCTSLVQAPSLPATTLAGNCYNSMFQDCTSLVQPPELPATTLAGNCYQSMFSGCTSLVQAPELPATALEEGCYYNMFSGCTSLVQASSLPATTLTRDCYCHMFSGCTSLVQPPNLPATTLVDNCYSSMFSGCTSLVQAPSLPATTLAYNCYSYMFSGCTSLVQPPNLPATALARFCYSFMFSDCTALKEVRISATTTADNALTQWLENVSATGDFYCDPNATIFLTNNTSGIPDGWTRRNINLLNALTLTATADNSSVKLTKNGTLDNTFEVDTGNGWTAYEFDTVIPLNAGQSCKWRCSAHPTTQSYSDYVNFVMTGSIEASGNCNSMLSSDFEGITSLTGYNFAFASLFQGCMALKQAPSLPATTLAESCYYKMFFECTNLVQAPELPALSIPDSFLAGREGMEVFGCYVSMFERCLSLVQAPALPATTLGKGCYVRMFYGCQSLVQAPALPATTLPDVLSSGGTRGPYFGCYSDMFGGCTALVQAPALPATTLGGACYGWMFYECRSLVKAPELPATKLTLYCYAGMFGGCTSLNEIRVSATDISADSCTFNWVQNVPSTGDFYCNPDTAWTTGGSGIPRNWTRRNIADYPQT